MKKIFFFILLSASSTIFSQKTNPLFQVMNSSTMLERPVEFRSMQNALKDEMGKQAVGLNLNLLRSKIDEFKNKLRRIDSNISVHFSTNKINIAAILGKDTSRYSIDIKFDKAITLNTIFLSLENSLAAIIDRELFQKIPNQFFNSPEFGEAFYSGVVAGLKQGNYLNDFSGYQAETNSKTLANITSKLILKFLKDKLQNEGIDVEKFAQKLDDVLAQFASRGSDQYQTIEKLNSIIKEVINTASNKLSEYLVEVVNRVDYNIVAALSKLNDHFISGDVGFAVSQGEGNLDGGINYLFRVNSNLRMGVFYNGQFNTAANKTNETDTTTSNSLMSLIGIQVKFASNNFELNGLVSKIYGSNSTNTFEAGLGISWRSSDSFIIGLAAFYQEERPTPESFSKFSTIGLTFRGTVDNSPSLLIGLSGNRADNAKPIFQISYPIPIVR